MPANAPLSFPASEVRRLDRDRFVTALFAPAARREALFGLYAFNAEIAQIRTLVREPMLGRIRLQWWRDTLDDLRSGKAVAHPIAEALGEAIRTCALSAEPFAQLLATREQDLEGEPPRDLAAFEAYAEGTAATLCRLALEVLGTRDERAMAAGHSVGIAWGMTGLLRAVPFHAATGRVFLPTSLLADRGVSVDDLLAGRKGGPLADVAKVIAAAARTHLEAARRDGRALPRAALPALLCAVQAAGYLRSLAAGGFNLLDPRWSTPRPQLARLGWRMLRGRL